MVQHAKATVTCLLAGVDVFAHPLKDPTTYIKILKGLYGLHLYATEYWTDYLICSATDLGNGGDEADLWVLANSLAYKVDNMFDTISIQEPGNDGTPLDTRINLLSQYPVLQKQIRVAQKARSLKQVEAELSREHGWSSFACLISILKLIISQIFPHLRQKTTAKL